MESHPGSIAGDDGALGRELLLPDLPQFRHLTSSLLGPWRQRDARLRALKLKWPLPPDGLSGDQAGRPGLAAPPGGKRKRQNSPEDGDAVDVHRLKPGCVSKGEDEEESDAENSRWRPWLSRLLPAVGSEADAGGSGGSTTEAWICCCHWVPPGSTGSDPVLCKHRNKFSKSICARCGGPRWEGPGGQQAMRVASSMQVANLSYDSDEAEAEIVARLQWEGGTQAGLLPRFEERWELAGLQDERHRLMTEIMQAQQGQGGSGPANGREQLTLLSRTALAKAAGNLEFAIMSLVEDQRALLRMDGQASEGPGGVRSSRGLARGLDTHPSDAQCARLSSEPQQAAEATGPPSSDIIRLLEQYGMAGLDEDSAVSMLCDCLICVAKDNQCLETDGWLLEHLFSTGRSEGEAGASASLDSFSGHGGGEVLATQASQAEPLVAATAEARAPGCAQAWAPRPSAEEPAPARLEDASAAPSPADRHLQRATDATAHFAWELLGGVLYRASVHSQGQQASHAKLPRRKPGLLLPPAPNLLSRALTAASNRMTGLTAPAGLGGTGFPGLSEQRYAAAASVQARLGAMPAAASAGLLPLKTLLSLAGRKARQGGAADQPAAAVQRLAAGDKEGLRRAVASAEAAGLEAAATCQLPVIPGVSEDVMAQTAASRSGRCGLCGVCDAMKAGRLRSQSGICLARVAINSARGVEQAAGSGGAELHPGLESLDGRQSLRDWRSSCLWQPGGGTGFHATAGRSAFSLWTGRRPGAEPHAAAPTREAALQEELAQLPPGVRMAFDSALVLGLSTGAVRGALARYRLITKTI